MESNGTRATGGSCPPIRLAAQNLAVRRLLWWRRVMLPAIFPAYVTGAVTAAGGSWNASIVAEYTTFNNHTYSVTGLGSLISEATASANFGLLAASTLTMIAIVIQ